MKIDCFPGVFFFTSICGIQNLLAEELSTYLGNVKKNDNTFCVFLCTLVNSSVGIKDGQQMVLHFDACTYVLQQEDGETNGSLWFL